MASLRTRIQIQRLVDTRDQLRAEMEALRHKIEGVELALSLLDESPEQEAAAADSGSKADRPPRGNVKATLLILLKDAGAIGLNAQSAVEMASKRGFDLDRGTASSLLSRFKRDGVVDHDGERYRLKMPAPSSGSAAN